MPSVAELLADTPATRARRLADELEWPSYPPKVGWFDYPARCPNDGTRLDRDDIGGIVVLRCACGWAALEVEEPER